MVYVIAWIAICAVLMVLEAMTMGLTTIWFAGGALVAAVLAALKAPLVAQIVVFVVVSLVLLYFTRPVVSKYFNKNLTKTNVESVVGKQAYVSVEIDNVKATGQVKIDGMDWTARSSEDGKVIPEGTLVKVVKIDGVKAIVE